jgi:glucokinase
MLRSSSHPPQTTNNILGMNIDGERVLLVYGSISGRVYESLTFPSPANEPFPSMLEALSTMSDRLLSLVQAQRLPLPDKISVSISGNYDDDIGILESSTDFPLWRSVPLRSQLALRFNLPTLAAKRSDAGVMAEALFGVGQDARNLVFVSLTPSVRVGILTNGALYRNPGGTAGEIGIVPLDKDNPSATTLNTYASPAGIVSFGQKHFPQHWPDDVQLPAMIVAANHDDPYARELFELIADKLAQGLAGVVHTLRPELVVIGQPLCLLDTWMMIAFRSALAKATCLPESKLPKVEFSSLCNRLPELQALAPAIFATRNPKA